MSLHELVDGLIMNWVLDPKYMPLAREAKILVDQYLDQLRAAPHKRAPGSGAVRKAVWAPSRAISQFQPVCL